MNLGGSPDSGFGHQADGTYLWSESRAVRIDWDTVPAGAPVRARVFSRCEAGASTTPEIYNVTDAEVVGSAAAPTTDASFQTDGSEDVIDIPRPAGNGVKYYRGRSTISGAAALNVWSYGLIGILDSEPGRFLVTVTGEDVTEFIRKGDGFQVPEIDLKRNQRGRFVADLELEPRPAKRAPVIVWNKTGTQKIYGGIVHRAQRLYTLGAPACWRMECLDFSRYLDFCIWTKQYTEDTTLAQVLADFVDEKLGPNYAITLHPDQVDGPTLTAPFGWTNARGATVIGDLRDLSGYMDEVSPDLVLRMFAPGTVEAPVTLSTALRNVANFQPADSTQIRANTVIGIFGPAGIGEPIDQTWIADGVATSFSLAGINVPAAHDVTPGIVLVDDVPYPVLSPDFEGEDGIIWDPATDDGTLTFLGTFIDLIPEDAVIHLAYAPQYPFTLTATNGGEPIVEDLLERSDILQYAQGVQLLEQFLAQTDQDPRVMTMDTLEDGIEIGHLLPIDIPDQDAADTEAIVTGVRAVLQNVNDADPATSWWEYSIAAEETAGPLQADPITRLKRQFAARA